MNCTEFITQYKKNNLKRGNYKDWVERAILSSQRIADLYNSIPLS